jgi:hypothetical protein
MRYFLAHNETDVFHYGELLEGQVVETGQPHLEYFNSLNELKQRLSFFNIVYIENINEYAENINEDFLEEPNIDLQA